MLAATSPPPPSALRAGTVVRTSAALFEASRVNRSEEMLVATSGVRKSARAWLVPVTITVCRVCDSVSDVESVREADDVVCAAAGPAKRPTATVPMETAMAAADLRLKYGFELPMYVPPSARSARGGSLKNFFSQGPHPAPPPASHGFPPTPSGRRGAAPPGKQWSQKAFFQVGH